MNIHKNVRLTPLSRERTVIEVQGAQTPEATARARASVCGRCANGSRATNSKH